MGHRRIAFLVGLAGLLLCPPTAQALDRVAGQGFGYVVPGGFQPAPRKMREAIEKSCVEVSSQLPMQFKGRPTFRMFIVPEMPDFPEASVASYTFTLPEGQRQQSIATVKLDALESGVLQGVSALPDVRVTTTTHRNLGSDLLAAVSTLAYDHKTAGNRILRVAVITRNHVACLLLMDSPADREGTYRVHWDGVIGSLRLGTAADQEGFLLRYMPVFGVALGVLAVLAFVFIGHLRRRARERLRHVDESGFRGNTISDLKGSRAVDGLEIFDQEEPPPRVAEAPPLAVAPPLAAAPARAPEAPAEKDEDALDFDIPVREFDKLTDVIAGAGVANAGPSEDRPVRKPVERKVLTSSPGKKKAGPSKIVRNDDYLRD